MGKRAEKLEGSEDIGAEYDFSGVKELKEKNLREDCTIGSRASVAEKLMDNNLRVFAIQAVVAAISYAMLIAGGFIFGGGGISFVGAILSASAGLAVYMFLGYKFVRPIPKWNFLSVAGLALVFGAIFGFPFLQSLLAPHGHAAYSEFAVLNIAAIEAVVFGYKFFGYNESQIFSRLHTVHLLAAFLPSLCIYLGLCLKIWLQKRKQS